MANWSTAGPDHLRQGSMLEGRPGPQAGRPSCFTTDRSVSSSKDFRPLGVSGQRGETTGSKENGPRKNQQKPA